MFLIKCDFLLIICLVHVCTEPEICAAVMDRDLLAYRYTKLVNFVWIDRIARVKTAFRMQVAALRSAALGDLFR